MSALGFIRLECLTNSSNVEPVLPPQVLTHLVDFFDDWIGALHLVILAGSYSDVHITVALERALARWFLTRVLNADFIGRTSVTATATVGRV
jgi:hypothetical protein